MAQKSSQLASALKAIGPSRRSELHNWLVAQYASLAPILNQASPNWISAAAEVAAHGGVGANGKPPSPNALRQMWRRIQRDAMLEMEKKAALKRPRKPPARSPAQSVRYATNPLLASSHTPPASTIQGQSVPKSGASSPDRPISRHPPTPTFGAGATDIPEGLPDHVREQFEIAQRLFTESDRKRYGRF